jgi:hypothetical protein
VALRRLRSSCVKPFTAISAQEATDIRTNTASNNLPTASDWVMKWAKPVGEFRV